MAIHLEEYRDLCKDLPGQAHDLLRATWSEAARAFSTRGLDNYLQGALALHHLGRGEQLVVSYLQAMPELARAVGEDMLPELVNSLLAMASKTSGAVLALVVSSAPQAAQRLGDEELFRQYLGVLSLMLAQVPRGVRPMLEHLEPLLSQLTLGGLRRWVQWGAQAYRNDFEGQQRYFSLASVDALSVLQQQRKGTLFVAVQRRLTIYLRAIWGRDVYMRPTSGDYEDREGLRPWIDGFVVHVADAYDDWLPPHPPGAQQPAVSGLELYRAALNHCTAHLVHTRRALPLQQLSPLQVALVGLVEDARVEALAIAGFPNMRQAWLALHPRSAFAPPRRVGELLERLARALLEDDPADPHPWVRAGVERFAAERDLGDGRLSLRLGLDWANGLQELGLPEYDRRVDVLRAPYRDDNRLLWTERAAEQDLQSAWQAPGQVRRKASVMEMVNEVDCEFAGDDAQEVWVLPTEFHLDQEGVSINSLEGRPPVSDPVHYPEWDYQIQLERPGWATVLERHAPLGDSATIDAILGEHKPVASRLKLLIESMVPRGLQRLRRQIDGDDIDLDAAVRSLADLRLGQAPDPRCMVRLKRVRRDLAVMVLLDLSESSNDKVRGMPYSVLDLTRSASVLLAEALQRIGDPFAVHGFCSDGRHDVQYYRFKDFEQPYGDLARARLAGMRGRYSTRMGAALRHAGRQLARQPQRRKVCLVVTDGEPADNDVRDPQYLRHDTRKAVEALAREGITVYALSLDPHADLYVSRIFGGRNFTVIDKVERLPEKLPLLYLSLTR